MDDSDNEQGRHQELNWPVLHLVDDGEPVVNMSSHEKVLVDARWRIYDSTAVIALISLSIQCHVHGRARAYKKASLSHSYSPPISPSY